MPVQLVIVLVKFEMQVIVRFGFWALILEVRGLEYVGYVDFYRGLVCCLMF